MTTFAEWAMLVAAGCFALGFLGLLILAIVALCRKDTLPTTRKLARIFVAIIAWYVAWICGGWLGASISLFAMLALFEVKNG